ncbi:alpha-E domain-containing protein [Acetobacteraceae bacterium H6797]|nr:alpha-E domain-containing protein [Acetobacteraceae bacterium H6797]
MLSRTADSLFWLGRYTERAGNVARGIGASLRMASIAAPLGTDGDEWRALLVATGTDPGFRLKYDAATQEAAVHWLTLDAENPSSIVSCIEAARRNGRAVRTALTADMWEAINDTWNEARRLDRDSIRGDRLPGFLDWVKGRTMLFNGSTTDTMLRDDAWRFLHLGTMLERADNTARLLDVRHAAFDPAQTPDAHVTAQWQAVLRSVSALRAYQYVNRARLEPTLIIDLMVNRVELPRSLLSCYARVDENLAAIAAYTGRRGPCHDIATSLHATVRDTPAAGILATGLHDFLTGLIDRNIELGAEIGKLYLSG